MTGFVGVFLTWSGAAQAQNDPPGRVGRLAYTNGTVSFHDSEQSEWSPAAVNTPLTTGDSLWTEPNARSEISLAGTRIRMEGATQLDLQAVDDTQTRLQLDQGRIDVKSQAMDTRQPYQIATPRGTISLQQQGDYYVEAGSTDDPTRLGVRSGAAQIEDLNGQVLAVRAGEVGEVTGDAAAPQLRTIHSAPPPQPAVWADRDRQVVYDQPPQYLSAGVTGYEDLNAYGSWTNDGSYGEVWVPRAMPVGWAPYRTGHWAYVQPWGWTWVDDQPWGFAPYHYGRWANRGGRWMWVPPQREAPAVYAPALVAFVGGVELAAALSNQRSAPVGWFPLGPREVYVPPYTSDPDYYRRLNRPARIDDQVLNDRWQRAERHEAFVAGRNSALMNQRFATVVPATAFVQSQPVMRAALQVPPNKIAAVPVAPVAAPPAPMVSVATAAPATALPPAAAPAPAAPHAAAPSAAAPPAAAPTAAVPAAAANLPVARTAVANMSMLARPAAVQAPAAPGPKFAATQPTAPTAGKPAVPALVPRQGVAPPALNGAVTPAPSQPAKPGEPPRQQQAAPQPQAAPSAAPSAAPPPSPAQPQHQAAPPPSPAQPQHQAAPPPPAQPQHQAAPPPPAQPQHQAAPPPPPAQPQHQAAPPPPPQPQHQAAPPPPPQPQPQHQAAPPPPQQQGHAAPPPAAPPPPQAHPAPPPPQQAQAPHPAPQPQQQAQQAPQPKKPDEKK